jgi:uncharacterized protein (DUF1697 family)
MSLVVFFRGVNVGGHKAFRPSALAKQLAELDVASVGAAGTFVIRKNVGQSALRSAIRQKLPFEPEMMIVAARDVVDLAAADPFSAASAGADVVKYLSVLAKRPGVVPKLPVERPGADDWQVKLFEIRGRFVLSLHRRLGRRLIYPNEVVEKTFGVPATTRNWNTINAVCDVLRRG